MAIHESGQDSGSAERGESLGFGASTSQTGVGGSAVGSSHPSSQSFGSANRLGDAIHEQADHLQKRAAAVGAEAGEFAREQLDHVREAAGDYYQRGRKEGAQLVRALESHIRQQPVKSVLIAAGIGVLFGAMWVRR